MKLSLANSLQRTTDWLPRRLSDSVSLYIFLSFHFPVFGIYWLVQFILLKRFFMKVGELWIFSCFNTPNIWHDLNKKDVSFLLPARKSSRIQEIIYSVIMMDVNIVFERRAVAEKSRNAKILKLFNLMCFKIVCIHPY